MVLNNNSELTRELINGARLQVTEGVPNLVINSIQPVMEVNPRLLKTSTIVRSLSVTNTGSSTFYTTPANQDFFLAGINLNVAYDATADSTSTYSQATIDGSARTILEISKITTTAQDRGMAILFNPPIKIDRGTAITLVRSFSVGTAKVAGSIFGYLNENSNA